jgi:hypothetical protein
MPYWVYGRDAVTREARDPLFIETETEADARAQAVEAGLEIEETEYVHPHGASDEAAEPEEAPAEPWKCPRCGEAMTAGVLTIHPSLLGQLLRGTGWENLYFDPGPGGSEEKVFDWLDRAQAFRCAACKAVVIPG